MKAMFSNSMGSRYFNPVMGSGSEKHQRLEREGHSAPSVWIGEVSWLKAGLLEDSDTFIPQTVMKVHEIIGEDLPVIDDALIEKVRGAFELPNNTKKPDGVMNGNGYALAKVDEVVKWLEEHKGEKAFTISW